MTVLKKKDAKINENWFGEERPTKLKISNSNPLGGDMDGMGDLDNAPMPPMGADGMGMDNQIDSDVPQDAMAGEPPMDDINGLSPEEPPKNIDNDNYIDISDLSLEDQVAVEKYKESLEDKSKNDSEGGEMPQNDMPMESRRNYKRIIDEVVDSVLNDTKERDETNLPKAYGVYKRTKKNPFLPQSKFTK